jgi:hypothetical protein
MGSTGVDAFGIDTSIGIVSRLWRSACSRAFSYRKRSISVSLSTPSSVFWAATALERVDDAALPAGGSAADELDAELLVLFTCAAAMIARPFASDRIVDDDDDEDEDDKDDDDDEDEDDEDDEDDRESVLFS